MTGTRTALLLAGAASALALAAPGPAAASPPTELHCGQTVTQSVTLEADLVDCPGDGLVVGADGITVDLNGHTIDGVPASGCDPTPAATDGIRDSGYDDVTVEGGTVRQFDFGFEGSGIRDSRVHHLALRESRFDAVLLGSGSGPAATARNLIDHNVVSGVSCGGGIGLNTGRANRFAYNVVEHTGDTAIGVCCGELSDGNVIDHNRIAATGKHGIVVFISGSSRIEGNVLTDIGNRGIVIAGASSNAVVTDNLLTRVHSFGIAVFGCIGDCAGPPGETGVRVEGNRLDAIGDGILLINTDDDVVRGNSVTGAASFGDPNAFGLGVLLDGVSGTEVVGNAIADGGRGPGPGILLGIPPEFGPSPRPVSDNVVARNRVTRQHADGIAVEPVAQDTILRENLAVLNAADGIHVLSPATVLERNVAVANGALGIDAVAGVTDAGGNLAHGNGDPAQCTGVACG